MGEREISQAVISRLPRYYRYLRDLKNAGKERISSQELSRIMKVTASQIRQDFNHFGGFGQQGYGYNTSYLYEEIGKILGLTYNHRMVLVGAGHLGQAVLRYVMSRQSNFEFICAFDIDKNVIGDTVAGVPVRDTSELTGYVRKNDIDIAVLAIPKSEAHNVAHSLIGTGIRGIWNFAHIDLEMPDDIQVENVHLQDSLMKLSYNLHRDEQQRSVN